MGYTEHMAPKERAPKPKPPAAAVRTPARKRRLPDGETEPPASIKKPKQQWSWGVTWMLFRVASVITLGLADRVVEKWTRCTGKTDKHVADSYVHRYHYEVGFLQDDHAEEAANPGIAAARRRTRQLGLGKIKSHPDRVTKFAIFERFVLERCPNHPWAAWLRGLPVQGNDPLDEADWQDMVANRVAFVPPTKGLVEQYIDSLRWGNIDPAVHSSFQDNAELPSNKPVHKGGTIRVYVASITATVKEFGADPVTKGDDIVSVIKDFIEEDGKK